MPTEVAPFVHARNVPCANRRPWAQRERESATVRTDDRLQSQQSLCIGGFARPMVIVCVKMTAISGAKRRFTLNDCPLLPSDVHVQTRAKPPARNVNMAMEMPQPTEPGARSEARSPLRLVARTDATALPATALPRESSIRGNPFRRRGVAMVTGLWLLARAWATQGLPGGGLPD